MGKRNKKKRQQEEAARRAAEAAEEQQADEPAPEEVNDASVEQPAPIPEPEVTPEPQPQPEDVPAEAVAEPAPEPAPEYAPIDDPIPPEEDIDVEDEEETEDIIPAEPDDEPVPKSKGFVGSYWMLILGVLLAAMGVAAIILLRTNFIQVYIMGVRNPSPSVGSEEMMAYVGSIVPFAIGLFTIDYWGRHAPVPRDLKTKDEELDEDVPERVPEEPEVEEFPEPAPPADFGHEHLPAAHLSPVEKIKHLTRSYSQGKISEGLYNENLAKFERELEEKPCKPEEPAPEADYGHEHLPPAHLSPEDKIDHLTKAYASGKISKGLYERDLARFEEEEKREQAHMPPHHLTVKEKMEHLENAYRQGRISKGTYDKNVAIFKGDIELDLMQALVMDDSQPEEILAPEAPETIESAASKPSPSEEETMTQLDSLLDEIEKGNDTPEMREKLRKKKEESFEDKILQEIEDLEGL